MQLDVQLDVQLGRHLCWQLGGTLGGLFGGQLGGQLAYLFIRPKTSGAWCMISTPLSFLATTGPNFS